MRVCKGGGPAGASLQRGAGVNVDSRAMGRFVQPGGTCYSQRVCVYAHIMSTQTCKKIRCFLLQCNAGRPGFIPYLESVSAIYLYLPVLANHEMGTPNSENINTQESYHAVLVRKARPHNELDQIC